MLLSTHKFVNSLFMSLAMVFEEIKEQEEISFMLV